MNSAFAPYSYEVMHTKEGTHYRVRDAGDNRVATCYLEENAQAIVAALNANRPEVEPIAPACKSAGCQRLTDQAVIAELKGRLSQYEPQSRTE